MPENEKPQKETKHVVSETFTLKSGDNAPDPRTLLAKHDEQRDRAEREARPSLIKIINKEIHQAEYFNQDYREISVNLLKAIVNLLGE